MTDDELRRLAEAALGSDGAAWMAGNTLLSMFEDGDGARMLLALLDRLAAAEQRAAEAYAAGINDAAKACEDYAIRGESFQMSLNGRRHVATAALYCATAIRALAKERT